ncbi:MAG: PLP-dependent aminotransferase family protein [Desulfurococcales archaeon]|nr:PLP-dependent aminotransferase family protein [Desulfurococcales archaeon]
MSGGIKGFLSSRMERVRRSEIREILKLTEGRRIISFAGGLPDPSVFPKEKLADIAREVIESEGDSALQYSPSRGVTSFRRVLRSFLESHGVSFASEDDLIVTTGSQEALYLIGKVLVDERDIVLIEEPGYLAAINVFHFYSNRLKGIPVDEYGLNTDALEDKVKRLIASGEKPKLIYTNPTCQNPTGATMPVERRKHLLEIASRYDLLIVEDDPYSFFTFYGERPPHLKALDREDRVIYAGTFSKILVPGIRLGYAVAPEPVIAAMESMKQMIDLHTPTFSQYLTMRAIERGVVDETIERAKRVYRIKRDAMINALEEEMRGLGSWTRPVGGFFTLLSLNMRIDTRELLVEAVEKANVAFVPAHSFYVENVAPNTMRLSYSNPSKEDIDVGVRRLARLIKEKAGIQA